MQLALPWFLTRGPAKRAEKPPVFLEIGRSSYRLTIARHRRARRYVLRMTPDGGLRLTVPRGASVAGGVAFAKGQGAWIARETARRLVRDGAWADGGLVWFRGERVALETLVQKQEGTPVREAFQSRLRELANAELPPRCAELALQHGLTVTRVTVRNQRSRWGSCSSKGSIALNWRLIQMPASVSDYVILHELMHLRQPNHSRNFWREVANVCDGWRAAEQWLRTHGRELL